MKGRLLPASFLIALTLMALGVIALAESYAGEVYPWGATRIGADIVHAYNKGAGVKVAILDSGIDMDHPDLNVVGGINFHPNDQEGNIDPNNWDDDEEGYGYGTAEAGIVAARLNGTGVVGVAPEVQLYAVRVVGWWGCRSIERLIAGVEWSTDPNGDGDTSDRMDVICLGATYSKISADYPDLHAACDAAWEAGSVLVVSAGNRGYRSGKGDSVEGPGRYASVIAVGATDMRDKRWMSDSNVGGSPTGPDLELMAPGDEITSTLVGGGYGVVGTWGAYESGTSLAAAHVAGVATLVIATGITDANGNGRINDDVRQRLIETADDLGSPGFDWQFGYGIVDAEEAAPPGPINLPPVVTIASPLNGSTFESGTSVYFEGMATDPEDGDVADALIWESSIDGSIGMGGSFFATLSDGTHTITASATDSGGATGSSSVTITVGSLIRLNAAAETDKYYYIFGETVFITVTVTDADNPLTAIAGADVHIDILTPNGKTYTDDGVTDQYGVAAFSFYPRKGDGQKIYTLTAAASKAGCEPGSGSATFYVYKYIFKP